MRGWTMRGVRTTMTMIAMAALTAACEDADTIFVPGNGPDAPRALAVAYYAGAVTVSWELGPYWNGEPFRVYSKRASDSGWFLIAETTNCIDEYCEYVDVNVFADTDYDYYVAAVDDYGNEAATPQALRIHVPRWSPPPVPGGIEVVALDGANYLRWDDRARDAGDFSHYRVWLWLDGAGYLLGETDSEGFLDELAENGLTYEYYVSAVDADGHESDGSASGFGTPRPDYHGEVLYDWFSTPNASGFVFREDESIDPIVSGSNGTRHFRLEVDAGGWWLVPGPGVQVHRDAWATTALRCGPGADAGCTALDVAPTSGYGTDDTWLQGQTTYVLRVPGDDGKMRYAVLRVEMLGYDQDDRPLVIFDWAYQLQVGNPALAPIRGPEGGLRPRG